MEFSNIHYVAFWGFIVALAWGAIAQRTHFCPMGAVSDWVNMGNTNRLRAWFLAIGIAILGAQLLTIWTPIDLRKSIYLTTNFGWLGHLLGGLLFGVGMTLGSGCGQRTLVRVGGGNLKSLVVLLVLAITAYMTLAGLIALVRLNVIEVTNLNLTQYQMPDQAIYSFLAKAGGLDNARVLRWAVAALFGIGLVIFALKSAEFRRSVDNLLAGIAIGLFVVAGWYITGVIGFDDFEPAPLTSNNFVGPVADSLLYLMTYTGATITFGIAAAFGVLLGSFVYAVATGKFRVETFASRSDMLAHLGGGALMGVGGVMALGCTVGQGITGMSTLALGSLLTLVAIIFGSAVTMKVQYHLLDQPGFWRALRLALAEVRLLPSPRKPKTA